MSRSWCLDRTIVSFLGAHMHKLNLIFIVIFYIAVPHILLVSGQCAKTTPIKDLDRSKFNDIWYLYGTLFAMEHWCFLNLEENLYTFLINDIIATDFKNYAVHYSCHQRFRKDYTYKGHVYVFSHVKEPSNKSLSDIAKALKTVKVDLKDLELVNQTSCVM